MSSQDSNSDQAVYAAGQLREYLKNSLEGKENSEIREYAGLIDDPAVLDWLNHRCSIYADHGENFLDTRLAEIVIRSAATRTADRALKEGNASQAQGIVGLVRHENSDGAGAITEVAQRLSNEGCVALVVGPPGAGKTATTLDVARAWGVRTGGHIFGNTSWSGFDDVVHTDVEMLEKMAHVEGQALGVIDESNQNLSGEGADSVKAQAFVDRMTFVRKKEGSHGPHAKRGSVLMVGHTLMKTAADIRRLATLVVQKPSRADPGRLKVYESEGGKDTMEEIAASPFKGLTDTRESYSEHEASHFDVVLEDEGDDEEGPSTEDVEDAVHTETAIRAAEPWTDGGGMAYREIADTSGRGDMNGLVPYSKSWVGDRVREWKEGQHRDLVPDPRTDSEGESA